jgi:uncharacterized protein (DUF1697 family)
MKPITRVVAFLRAINVGGRNVKMAELRRHFEALGLTDVETFIASGNVIFTPRTTNTKALEKKIEARLRAALGYEVHTFVRTLADVAAIARYEPFDHSRMQSAGALYVGFLAEPLGAAGTKAVMAMKTAIDEFHVHGRELYWLCQQGQSQSTFSNARFEKTLAVRATFRGARTVAQLAARYGGT